MKINNTMTLGAFASFTVSDSKTNDIKFVSDELHNKVYADISNVMLNGFPNNPQFLLGESNVQTTDDLTALVSPFSTQSSLSEGALSVSRVSPSELKISQKLYFHVTPQLNVGEVRFIREMGLEGFDRFILQSSRGKMFAIEIDDNSVIEVDMTLVFSFKLDNADVTLRLLKNGTYVSPVTGKQRIHYNEVTKFPWRKFLSASTSGYLKISDLTTRDIDTTVTTTDDTVLSPMSASSSLTANKNEVLTEFTYIVAKGQKVMQIRASLGFGGMFLSLTPDSSIVMPAEIVYIKTVTTLRR